MKPIEPGCKCIILKDKHLPENVGKVVTVTRRYEPKTAVFFRYDNGKLGRFKTPVDSWGIVESIPMVVLERAGKPIPPIPISGLICGGVPISALVADYRLMRIDGDDFEDNPYQEKKPISDILNTLQDHWIDFPETWDEYQRRTVRG